MLLQGLKLNSNHIYFAAQIFPILSIRNSFRLALVFFRQVLRLLFISMNCFTYATIVKIIHYIYDINNIQKIFVPKS